MEEWVWLNGEILPMGEARIGVEDRGFQFADGVYEVVRLYGGKPFTMKEHLDRLERSCAGIQLPPPPSREYLQAEIQKLLDRTRIGEGMIYLQMTRGASPRNHVFPNAKPTLLFYVRPLPVLPEPGKAPGVKLHTVVDERWKRCWIKTVALLPNVLAKNAAIAAGADEAVFLDEGVVTECSASNVYIIKNGQLITHPVGPKVLPGITRLVVLEVARQVGVEVVERPYTEAQALAADEVFITSTTREIGWVARWNDKAIGRGCGPVTLKLHQALHRRVNQETH